MAKKNSSSKAKKRAKAREHKRTIKLKGGGTKTVIVNKGVRGKAAPAKAPRSKGKIPAEGKNSSAELKKAYQTLFGEQPRPHLTPDDIRASLDEVDDPPSASAKQKAQTAKAKAVIEAALKAGKSSTSTARPGKENPHVPAKASSTALVPVEPKKAPSTALVPASAEPASAEPVSTPLVPVPGPTGSSFSQSRPGRSRKLKVRVPGFLRDVGHGFIEATVLRNQGVAHGIGMGIGIAANILHRRYSPHY